MAVIPISLSQNKSAKKPTMTKPTTGSDKAKTKAAEDTKLDTKAVEVTKRTKERTDKTYVKHTLTETATIFIAIVMCVSSFIMATWSAVWLLALTDENKFDEVDFYLAVYLFIGYAVGAIIS